MAVLDPIKPTILATRLIPNVDRTLAAQLELREDQRSLALVTCDIDDSLYASLDEATKMAEVEVDPETGKGTRVKIGQEGGEKVRIAKSGKVIRHEVA